MSRMARLPSYQRVLVVIYRSFHREPDGSDRRFCCQLHVSVSQEQEFSLSTHTLAPNCEASSGRSRTPVDPAFPASDRSRLVDQIDDDLLNLISVHENLKDRVFEFVLDRSRPPAGTPPSRASANRGRAWLYIRCPGNKPCPGRSYPWNVSFDEFL